MDGRRWKVLLVTSVAVFMALLDVTIVNIAFPDMRRSFAGEPLANLSWILNAYNIIFAAALIPAGRLADRFGRRRFFLGGIVVFLAASALCAGAGSVEMLITARVVQALDAAVLVPTSLSRVLPEFPPEKRATATALSTATGAIAAAIGPSLGGVLVSGEGWRWVFLVNLIIGVPALIPAIRLLRESRDERSRGWPDLLGALVLALGVAALALALVEGQDWGRGCGRILGTLAAAVILLVLFIVRSARHANPVVDLSLFRVPLVFGGKRGLVLVRYRVLRPTAQRRPVSDRRLGLLRVSCWSRGHAWSDHGHTVRTDRRADRRPLRAAGDRRARRAVVRPGRAVTNPTKSRQTPSST
jgi:EmrB/QacA subfamily drug resistance transporter